MPKQPTGQKLFHTNTDRIDEAGTLSLRNGGRLRQLGIGRAYIHEKVQILIKDSNFFALDHGTVEIIAEFSLDDSTDYQGKMKHFVPRTGVQLFNSRTKREPCPET